MLFFFLFSVASLLPNLVQGRCTSQDHCGKGQFCDMSGYCKTYGRSVMAPECTGPGMCGKKEFCTLQGKCQAYGRRDVADRSFEEADRFVDAYRSSSFKSCVSEWENTWGGAGCPTGEDCYNGKCLYSGVGRDMERKVDMSRRQQEGAYRSSSFKTCVSEWDDTWGGAGCPTGEDCYNGKCLYSGAGRYYGGGERFEGQFRGLDSSGTALCTVVAWIVGVAVTML